MEKSINFFLNVGQALFAAAEFLALLCLAMLYNTTIHCPLNIPNTLSSIVRHKINIF